MKPWEDPSGRLRITTEELRGGPLSVDWRFQKGKRLSECIDFIQLQKTLSSTRNLLLKQELSLRTARSPRFKILLAVWITQSPQVMLGQK